MLNYTDTELKNSIESFFRLEFTGTGLKSSLSHCKLWINKGVVYTKGHYNKYDLIVGTIKNDGVGYTFTPAEKYSSVKQFSGNNVTEFYHRILFEYIKHVHNYWSD